MNNSEKVSKTYIVVSVILIVIFLVASYFLLFNKKERIEYFTTQSSKKIDSILVEDFKTLKKLLKTVALEEAEITSSISYNKINILERFNEEYFANKKIAILTLYEDDSKSFMYLVDEIIYNDDKTEATVNYIYKDDGYAGRLSNSWTNYLFIELDKTVEKVDFVNVKEKQ